MPVRTEAQLLTQITTLAPDNTSAEITPADLRSLLTDIRDTLYDDATMRGVVLTSAAAGVLVTLLEGLTAGNRLSANFLDDLLVPAAWALNTGASGNMPSARGPVDSYNRATWSDAGRLSLFRRDGASVSFDMAETMRDLMAAFITGGTDIRVTHDDAANTLTLDFTGTGSGSSRTDAQVQELARDAVAAALRGEAIDPRITIAHDDAANTITLALSGIPDEYTNSDMLTAFNNAFRRDTSGPRVTLTYTPMNGQLLFQIAGLATVAGSGSYNDLSNRPTIPAAPAGFALASSPTGRIPEANAASESVIGGTISGQVITLTRRDGMNPITITIPSGGSAPPVSTHQRYGAYGSDSTFVATDFTGAGGVGSTNNSLTLAGATARSYVAFWSAMALTTINPDGRLAFGGNNLFSRFTGSRLTIGADNGYLYVSTSTFPTGVINGAWTLS